MNVSQSCFFYCRGLAVLKSTDIFYSCRVFGRNVSEVAVKVTGTTRRGRDLVCGRTSGHSSSSTLRVCSRHGCAVSPLQINISVIRRRSRAQDVSGCYYYYRISLRWWDAASAADSVWGTLSTPHSKQIRRRWHLHFHLKLLRLV